MSGYSWTYPKAECVDSVGLTLMRKALLEPKIAFTLSEVLGVFLILLAGAIIAFIVAGINRFVLYFLDLLREVVGFLYSNGVLIGYNFECIRYVLHIRAARCFVCSGQNREEV